MTQRNNHLQVLQATPIGVPESLRVALGLVPAFASILVLVLITVLHGAGFGYV